MNYSQAVLQEFKEVLADSHFRINTSDLFARLDALLAKLSSKHLFDLFIAFDELSLLQAILRISSKKNWTGCFIDQVRQSLRNNLTHKFIVLLKNKSQVLTLQTCLLADLQFLPTLQQGCTVYQQLDQKNRQSIDLLIRLKISKSLNQYEQLLRIHLHVTPHKQIPSLFLLFSCQLQLESMTMLLQKVVSQLLVPNFTPRYLTSLINDPPQVENTQNNFLQLIGMFAVIYRKLLQVYQPQKVPNNLIIQIQFALSSLASVVPIALALKFEQSFNEVKFNFPLNFLLQSIKSYKEQKSDQSELVLNMLQRLMQASHKLFVYPPSLLAITEHHPKETLFHQLVVHLLQNFSMTRSRRRRFQQDRSNLQSFIGRRLKDNCFVERLRKIAQSQVFSLNFRMKLIELGTSICRIWPTFSDSLFDSGMHQDLSLAINKGTNSKQVICFLLAVLIKQGNFKMFLLTNINLLLKLLNSINDSMIENFSSLVELLGVQNQICTIIANQMNKLFNCNANKLSSFQSNALEYICHTLRNQSESRPKIFRKILCEENMEMLLGIIKQYPGQHCSESLIKALIRNPIPGLFQLVIQKLRLQLDQYRLNCKSVQYNLQVIRNFWLLGTKLRRILQLPRGLQELVFDGIDLARYNFHSGKECLNILTCCQEIVSMKFQRFDERLNQPFSGANLNSLWAETLISKLLQYYNKSRYLELVMLLECVDQQIFLPKESQQLHNLLELLIHIDQSLQSKKQLDEVSNLFTAIAIFMNFTKQQLIARALRIVTNLIANCNKTFILHQHRFNPMSDQDAQTIIHTFGFILSLPACQSSCFVLKNLVDNLIEMLDKRNGNLMQTHGLISIDQLNFWQGISIRRFQMPTQQSAIQIFTNFIIEQAFELNRRQSRIFKLIIKLVESVEKIRLETLVIRLIAMSVDFMEAQISLIINLISNSNNKKLLVRPQLFAFLNLVTRPEKASVFPQVLALVNAIVPVCLQACPSSSFGMQLLTPAISLSLKRNTNEASYYQTLLLCLKLALLNPADSSLTFNLLKTVLRLRQKVQSSGPMNKQTVLLTKLLQTALYQKASQKNGIRIILQENLKRSNAGKLSVNSFHNSVQHLVQDDVFWGQLHDRVRLIGDQSVLVRQSQRFESCLTQKCHILHYMVVQIIKAFCSYSSESRGSELLKAIEMLCSKRPEFIPTLIQISISELLCNKDSLIYQYMRVSKVSNFVQFLMALPNIQGSNLLLTMCMRVSSSEINWQAALISQIYKRMVRICQFSKKQTLPNLHKHLDNQFLCFYKLLHIKAVALHCSRLLQALELHAILLVYSSAVVKQLVALMLRLQHLRIIQDQNKRLVCSSTDLDEQKLIPVQMLFNKRTNITDCINYYRRLTPFLEIDLLTDSIFSPPINFSLSRERSRHEFTGRFSFNFLESNSQNEIQALPEEILCWTVRLLDSQNSFLTCQDTWPEALAQMEIDMETMWQMSDNKILIDYGPSLFLFQQHFRRRMNKLKIQLLLTPSTSRQVFMRLASGLLTEHNVIIRNHLNLQKFIIQLKQRLPVQEFSQLAMQIEPRAVRLAELPKAIIPSPFYLKVIVSNLMKQVQHESHLLLALLQNKHTGRETLFCALEMINKENRQIILTTFLWLVKSQYLKNKQIWQVPDLTPYYRLVSEIGEKESKSVLSLIAQIIQQLPVYPLAQTCFPFFIVLITSSVKEISTSKMQQILTLNPGLLTAIKKKLSQESDNPLYERMSLLSYLLKLNIHLDCCSFKEIHVWAVQNIPEDHFFHLNIWRVYQPIESIQVARHIFLSYPLFQQRFFKIVSQYRQPILDKIGFLIKSNPDLFPVQARLQLFYNQLNLIKIESKPRRLKLMVRRDKIVCELFQSQFMSLPQAEISVHFINEEAQDGGGVTREWFNKLTVQFTKQQYGLFEPTQLGDSLQISRDWREQDLPSFQGLGRLLGKAVRQQCCLGLNLCKLIYKFLLSQQISLQDLKEIDKELYNNLSWILNNPIDSLQRSFVYSYLRFEQQVDIELVENGGSVAVTQQNKQEFVRRYVKACLITCIQEPLRKLKQNFLQVVPSELIQLLTDQQLEKLIEGNKEIDLAELRSQTDYEVYNRDSPQIIWFWEVVQNMTQKEKEQLLQFVTGSPRVPLRGFNNLRGINNSCSRFTIQKYYNSSNLPRAHTCFNQLDLPEYSSFEELRMKLLKAITEGCHNFGFA